MDGGDLVGATGSGDNKRPSARRQGRRSDTFIGHARNQFALGIEHPAEHFAHGAGLLQGLELGAGDEAILIERRIGAEVTDSDEGDAGLCGEGKVFFDADLAVQQLAIPGRGGDDRQGHGKAGRLDLVGDGKDHVVKGCRTIWRYIAGQGNDPVLGAIHGRQHIDGGLEGAAGADPEDDRAGTGQDFFDFERRGVGNAESGIGMTGVGRNDLCKAQPKTILEPGGQFETIGDRMIEADLYEFLGDGE